MARKRKKQYDSAGNEMPVYEDHAEVLRLVEEMQNAEQDNKERMREAHLFLDKRDGQWEQDWYDLNDGSPRYSFDKTSPIIDQVVQQIDRQEFAVVVDPAGGEASEDDADLMSGLIRSIENNSQAKTMVYKPSARNMIISGADGWEVVHDYIDDDSFDMDLRLEKVNNWSDRVWFETQTERPDHADCECAIKTTAFSKKNFKKKWPNRDTANSIELPVGEINSTYWHKRDVVMVGTIHYIKYIPRKLAKMEDGSIYEVNDDFLAVVDEMEENGNAMVDVRDRPRRVQYTRKFDSQGWMEEPQETVFSYISLIPVYANFKVVDNKIIYRGVVEKLYDSQRVYNYSMSRHIEEGALAPRKKIWVTQSMVKGYETSIRTLNTNTDPVQFYNPDPTVPDGRPYVTGGPEVNEGLLALASEMTGNMSHTSGMYAANMGDNPNMQSGIAIQNLQDKGEDGNNGYSTSMEIAICHTFRVLASAIPRVYTNERQVRILNEDGTVEVQTINQVIFDQETMEEKLVRDMSKGQYNFSCKAGPSYQNRQEKTVASMLDVAAVKPELLDIGTDIFFANMTAPGMDMLAERARRQNFLAGIIPFEQLNDDEKQELELQQQQSQQQAPDPAVMLGQAELINAESTKAEKEGKLQLQYMQMGLQNRREDRADMQFQFTQQTESQRMMAEFEKRQQEQQQAQFKAQQDAQKLQQDQLMNMAKILESIQNSMGEGVSVVSTEAASAYDAQARRLNQAVGGNS